MSKQKKKVILVNILGQGNKNEENPSWDYSNDQCILHFPWHALIPHALGISREKVMYRLQSRNRFIDTENILTVARWEEG